MSLTPDYFISDFGYPRLNSEKYKSLTSYKIDGKPEIYNNVSNIGNSNEKRLLTRRGNNQSTISTSKNTQNINKNSCCKWANDKERKTALNEAIKKANDVVKRGKIQNQISRRNSQQLDNRLADRERRIYDKNLGNSQTDVAVLPHLDV